MNIYDSLMDILTKKRITCILLSFMLISSIFLKRAFDD